MTLYMSPITLILQQVFNNTGIVAQGGQVNVYEAGTTTPATTYTDSTGIVANANPLTLNSSGRAASASGALVAFWAPSGTVLKVVVTDNAGNLLMYLDQIQGINDPGSLSSLQTLLASPASSNSSGVGPVAGADLVANAVKSYDVFADVRAANAPVMASGQTLVILVQGGVSVGDELGGLFYWSPTSTTADDNSTVLEPTSTSGPGRYLRLVIPADTSISSTSGNFVATLTDGTSSVDGVIYYEMDNNGVVTLRANGSYTFTSGANTLTMTGLPAILFPAVELILPTLVIDNGNAVMMGGFEITHGGAIAFLLGGTAAVSGKLQLSSTGFTTSGVKGINNWSITYPTN